MDARPLAPLVGTDLSSVTFVRDYVQLCFHSDQPRLTCVTNPEVRLRDRVVRWGEPGYRDALCDRISVVVRDAYVVEGEEACVEFTDGVSVCVSLRPDDYRAAEALVFDDGQGNTWIW